MRVAKILKISLVILVLVCLSFGSLFVWNKNQEYKKYQVKLANCKQIFNKLVLNKIILNENKCQDQKTLKTFESVSNLVNIFEKQFSVFKTEVERLNRESDAVVMENNFFRENLNGDFNTLNIQEIQKTDLSLTPLEQKEQSLIKIKQFNQNKAKIQEFLKSKTDESMVRVGILKELGSSEPNVFLNNYKIKSFKEQVVEYALFRDRLNELNKSIELKLVDLEKNNKDLARKIRATEYKEFSSEEFRELYEKMVYDKTNPPAKDLEIYAVLGANLKVAQIAENRGYKKRVQAVESSLEVIGTQKLQTSAKKAFTSLTENANQDGIGLVLISGYRSVEDQIYLFTSRLGVSNNSELIAGGSLDSQIDKLLETTAAPTYSRHHTGYTFDLGCGTSDFTDFKNTDCYQWISKDNFYQAKKVGLIPSYPIGVERQGPNPETWEYVWVGVEKLKK